MATQCSNHNYERVILSSIIFENHKLERYKGQLHINTFDFEIHKNIYAAILELDCKDKPTTEDFILMTLRKKRLLYESELMEVMSTNAISNIEPYIKVLQQLHTKREIRLLTQQLEEEKITIAQFQNKLSKLDKTYKEKEKLDYEDIDYKRLPPYISDLIQDLAKINNYPSSMVLSTVLSSMAGLIGARAKINNGVNITVFPVVWSMIIAPSSLSAKSTLFRFTKKCVFNEMQNELFDEYEENLLEFKSELKRYQGLAKEDKQRETEPERPHPKLLIFANDGTPEAKIMSLSRNQNGGVVYFDEMKAELERSNKDPRYKALKTSIFDGEIYHKELVKDGGTTFILRHPVLSEVGLITEQWLLEGVQKNDIASGFMARYIFSFNRRSDFKPLQITEHMLKCEKYSDVGRFVIDMLDINRKEPLVFTLSPAAKNYYIEWFNNFSKTAYEIETDEEITASYRLSTYVLKFSLIIHIFEHAYQKIDIVASEMFDVSLDYIKCAIYLMEIFQEENHKILALFERNKKLNFKIDDITVKLRKKIQASVDKRLTKTEATNGIRGLTKKKMEELISQGLFKLEKIDRKSYILEI